MQLSGSNPAAARLQALERTHSDTTEINHTNDIAQTYEVGGQKPSSIFGLMCRALFREPQIKKNNKSVFIQVEADIRSVYGDKTADAFAATMKSKKDYGSPLTKGALAQFLKTQNASLDVTADKVADAINVLAKDTKIIEGYGTHNGYLTTEGMKLDRLTNSDLSPLTAHYGVLTPPSYDLKAFFTKNQITQIKKQLLNLKENDVKKLFDKSTSKAARIEILKKVLTPPTQANYDSDED
ncbi:MAG: hypothetical protein K2W97_06030 [Chthoniobacterales bacterium]|nr:hypothetical protein [Chthoniobacterales bacterium]